LRAVSMSLLRSTSFGPQLSRSAQPAGLTCLADIPMSPQKGQKGMRRPATPSALRGGAESHVMTVRDLTEYLHCHYGTVYRLIRQREIPGFELGRSWRFLKAGHGGVRSITPKDSGLRPPRASIQAGCGSLSLSLSGAQGPSDSSKPLSCEP
jgi:excisionase family DNA binding protein